MKYRTLEIFDPPLCCPTGVCGPSVSPELAAFAADVKQLQKQGVSVTRFNLAQQPGAFAENDHIRSRLDEKGPDCLPILLVDGKEAVQGRYPSIQELAELLGVQSSALEPPAADACCDEDSGCC